MLFNYSREYRHFELPELSVNVTSSHSEIRVTPNQSVNTTRPLSNLNCVQLEWVC